MKGVWGKVLKVDLTNGTCKAEELPDKVYEYFLGGAGLAAYYMWKECPAGTSAFNPANRITFAGGPMTGSETDRGRQMDRRRHLSFHQHERGHGGHGQLRH